MPPTDNRQIPGSVSPLTALSVRRSGDVRVERRLRERSTGSPAIEESVHVGSQLMERTATAPTTECHSRRRCNRCRACRSGSAHNPVALRYQPPSSCAHAHRPISGDWPKHDRNRPFRKAPALAAAPSEAPGRAERSGICRRTKACKQLLPNSSIIARCGIRLCYGTGSHSAASRARRSNSCSRCSFSRILISRPRSTGE